MLDYVRIINLRIISIIIIIIITIIIIISRSAVDVPTGVREPVESVPGRVR